jgi:hypothetical protein
MNLLCEFYALLSIPEYQPDFRYSVQTQSVIASVLVFYRPETFENHYAIDGRRIGRHFRLLRNLDAGMDPEQALAIPQHPRVRVVPQSEPVPQGFMSKLGFLFFPDPSRPHPGFMERLGQAFFPEPQSRQPLPVPQGQPIRRPMQSDQRLFLASLRQQRLRDNEQVRQPQPHVPQQDPKSVDAVELQKQLDQMRKDVSEWKTQQQSHISPVEGITIRIEKAQEDNELQKDFEETYDVLKCPFTLALPKNPVQITTRDGHLHTFNAEDLLKYFETALAKARLYGVQKMTVRNPLNNESILPADVKPASDEYINCLAEFKLKYATLIHEKEIQQLNSDASQERKFEVKM